MEKFVWAIGLDRYDFGFTPKSKKITPNNDIQTYSDEIVKNCKNGETIFLLSELVLHSSDNRIDLLGIEVLKWLRIKHHITNPIVLFGFIGLSQILQEYPEHIIITAPGISYVTIPTSPEYLTKVAEKLKPAQNIKEQYRKYIQADFKIEQFGHEFANELGCFKLSKEIEKLFGIKGFFDTKLSEQKLDWHKLELLYESRRTFTADSLKKTLNQLRALSKNKKVIYVDDKGDSGWFNILDFLLYGDDREFEKRQNNYYGRNKINLQISEGFTSFASKIMESNPNIVLLDLRLKGPEEKGISIEEISGSKLLKEIKKLKPELPVLILSATNKISSLEVLSKYPYMASDLWTKPRAEEGKDITKVLELLIFKIFNILSHCNKPYAKFIAKEKYIENQQVYLPKERLHKYDHIIFDTNFFCESRNAKHYAINLKCFDNLINDTSLRKKVVLIEDVLTELFINSYKRHIDKRDFRDTTELMHGISKHSIQKILKAILDQPIENFRSEVLNLLNSNIEYETNQNKEKWVVYRSRKIMINEFRDKERADRKAKNMEKANVNSLVYADNVFKYLIKHLSANQKVLFVSNDIRCKGDIYFYHNFKWSRHLQVDKYGHTIQHSNYVPINRVRNGDNWKSIPGLLLVKNSYFSSEFFHCNE